MTTTRREQTSGESRDLILTAAAELFARKGYRPTTFADVAELSGISRGSIPWHFGSKEGLLLAVLERSVEQLNAGLATSVSGPPTVAPEEFFARPTSKLFATLLVEALEPDSPIHDRYAAIHDTLRTHCRRILDQAAIPAGVSADALAVALVGAAIGIHQQWLVAPDRVDLGQSLTALGALLAAVTA